LTNDFDPDGSALSVTLPAVFGPQNGSIIMNAMAILLTIHPIRISTELIL
jgi:hypothetical protein